MRRSLSLAGVPLDGDPSARTEPAFGGGPATIDHDVITPDVETASPGYATRFQGQIGRYLLDIQAEAVLDFLPPREGGRPLRILEVGGGHGQLTPSLLERGHEVVVQGSRPTCCARILGLFHRYPGQLEFITSDLWSLPFADRAFDAVIGVRLLAHVERTADLLGEIGRVSRRTLIVDYPPLFSANLLEPLLFQLKRRLEGNTRPFFCYRTSRLLPPLAEAGFAEVRLTKQFFLPMVVHRTLARPGLSRRVEDTARTLGLTGLAGAPVLLAAERPAGAAA